MQDAKELLIAWLHDPPDKALDIRGHVKRTCRYLSAAVGAPVDSSALTDGHADQLASATERLPMPRWDAEPGTVVGAEQMRLLHPLSPQSAAEEPGASELELREEEVRAAIEELVDGVDEVANRFLVLWRRLPERLASIRAIYGRLPADTRVPDHAIWQHLDTTAGLRQVISDRHGGAFLCFSIGPVQSFIATARSVRDLWSGSMILSWLTFQAMLPVLDQLGPTAMVYPSLRGIPLVDLWLRRCGLQDQISLPEPLGRRMMPCIPNRFVAMVPSGEAGGLAKDLADRCRRAAADAWQGLAASVHGKLDPQFAAIDSNWDRHWRPQIESFFDFRASVLPWRECSDEVLTRLLTEADRFDDAFPEASDIRKLETAIPEGHRVRYSQRSAGQWQLRLELSARLLEADKGIRHVPPGVELADGEMAAAKCSLTGSAEQMGPPRTSEAARFWEEAAKEVRVGGVRIRQGEQLGAVALVKRFAGPAHFVEELELGDPRALRIDDTATIAAADWLVRAHDEGFDWLDPCRVREQHDEWSGQWLHPAEVESAKSTEEDSTCPEEVRRQIRDARSHPEFGASPAYYAVLVMDGDRLGEWLSGKMSPKVREVLHPQMLAYFEKLEGNAAGLDSRRPVTPALHSAISEALTNFALHFVPRIVEEHRGSLIYAGGDDVLALLPTVNALRCAAELCEAYRQPWATDTKGRQRLLMGPRATVSAGLAIVHHKEDLRFALETARGAEKGAKESGRDTLRIIACRRSGEHAAALCPWDFAYTVDRWTKAFKQHASDRWAYHLRASLPTLQSLPVEAMEAEIRRQMNRCEKETRELFGGAGDGKAADELVAAFREYRQEKTPEGKPRFDDKGKALEDFITLCQTASFLARGKDA